MRITESQLRKIVRQEILKEAYADPSYDNEGYDTFTYEIGGMILDELTEGDPGPWTPESMADFLTPKIGKKVSPHDVIKAVQNHPSLDIDEHGFIDQWMPRQGTW